MPLQSDVIQCPSIEIEPTKSKNQLKNETKRKEKTEKFLAKQEKLTQVSTNDNAKKNHSKSDHNKSTTKCDIPELNIAEGEFKDVSKYEMPSSYQPKYVEKNWYSWWESSGFFKPDVILKQNPNAPVYVIPIPPPNVTGSLHLGHAMATSIQDVLIRWKRMSGYAALYIPGCDHAGISCQVVVEKNLKKTRNLTRHDLGRLAFVGEVWKWKDTYGDRIYSQLKRLGGSMDWSRTRFTLDPSMSEAVTKAFITLFDQGIIYRANRIINWSSALQTAVSDLEVDHREIYSPIRLSSHGHDPKKTYEFGYIYSFAMKVIDSESDLPLEDEIVVCTTRPETIPGDVAVVVHPDDDRYKSFHGKYVQHSIHKTKIPIICDSFADMSFGTGAVKITPAHDQNDFDLGLRLNLPVVAIFDSNNRLNEKAGPKFSGMLRFDAREAIIAYLEEMGLYRGRKENPLVLPICNRSGDIIEPRILPQWWMKCGDLAAKSIEVVRSGELKILPQEAEKIWFNWLGNCRDWCLSRQLWWGHRVPAYSIRIFNKDSGEFEHKKWIAASSEENACQKAVQEFSCKEEELKVEQDPDVLDTWFSSALWPFATLGWPNLSSEDFNKFYPADVLETGRDIIFFWVARMVMMGIYLTGQVPFRTVYLHSIVRDAHGRKMSKSLGNVIDPIDVIEGITLENLHLSLEGGNLDSSEINKAKASQKKDFPNGIEECGSDALRFALLAYTSQGSDVNLDILRVTGYRRFCNKIWNFAKFVFGTLNDKKTTKFPPSLLVNLFNGNSPTCSKSKNGTEMANIIEILKDSISLFDQWILNRLFKTISSINSAFCQYNFMAVTSVIHSFILYDICDVYLETLKPILASTDSPQRDLSVSILLLLLELSLKMLHPLTPFITEELWQKLVSLLDDYNHARSISVSTYPTTGLFSEIFGTTFSDSENHVATIQAVVRSTRSLANDLNSKALNVTLSASDHTDEKLLKDNCVSIASLIKGIKSISITSSNSENALQSKSFDSSSARTIDIPVPASSSKATIQISVLAHQFSYITIVRMDSKYDFTGGEYSKSLPTTPLRLSDSSFSEFASSFSVGNSPGVITDIEATNFDIDYFNTDRITSIANSDDDIPLSTGTGNGKINEMKSDNFINSIDSSMLSAALGSCAKIWGGEEYEPHVLSNESFTFPKESSTSYERSGLYIQQEKELEPSWNFSESNTFFQHHFENNSNQLEDLFNNYVDDDSRPKHDIYIKNELNSTLLAQMQINDKPFPEVNRFELDAFKRTITDDEDINITSPNEHQHDKLYGYSMHDNLHRGSFYDQSTDDSLSKANEPALNRHSFNDQPYQNEHIFETKTFNQDEFTSEDNPFDQTNCEDRYSFASRYTAIQDHVELTDESFRNTFPGKPFESKVASYGTLEHSYLLDNTSTNAWISDSEINSVQSNEYGPWITYDTHPTTIKKDKFSLPYPPKSPFSVKEAKLVKQKSNIINTQVPLSPVPLFYIMYENKAPLANATFPGNINPMELSKVGTHQKINSNNRHWNDSLVLNKPQSRFQPPPPITSSPLNSELSSTSNEDANIMNAYHSNHFTNCPIKPNDSSSSIYSPVVRNSSFDVLKELKRNATLSTDPSKDDNLEINPGSLIQIGKNTLDTTQIERNHTTICHVEGNTKNNAKTHLPVMTSNVISLPPQSQSSASPFIIAHDTVVKSNDIRSVPVSNPSTTFLDVTINNPLTSRSSEFCGNKPFSVMTANIAPLKPIRRGSTRHCK